jgi:hypothetical protein
VGCGYGLKRLVAFASFGNDCVACVNRTGRFCTFFSTVIAILLWEFKGAGADFGGMDDEVS